jgi:hypothetical protein
MADEDLEDHKEELSRLVKHLDEVTQRLLGFASKFEAHDPVKMQDYLSRLESSFVQSREFLDGLRGKIEGIETHLQKLDSLERLHEHLKDVLEQKLAAQSAKLDEMSEKQDRHQAETIEKLDNHVTDHADLRRTIELLTQQVVERDVSMGELRKELRVEQARNGEIDAKNLQLNQQIIDLLAKLKMEEAITTELEAAKAEVARLAAELNKKTERVTKLVEQVTNYQVSNNGLLAEKTKLEEKLKAETEAHQKTKAAIPPDVTKLQGDLKVANDNAKKFEDELKAERAKPRTTVPAWATRRPVWTGVAAAVIAVVLLASLYHSVHSIFGSEPDAVVALRTERDNARNDAKAAKDAQDKFEAEKNAALSAKTNAETAKANAEAARNTAEDAKKTAEKDLAEAKTQLADLKKTPPAISPPPASGPATPSPGVPEANVPVSPTRAQVVSDQRWYSTTPPPFHPNLRR